MVKKLFYNEGSSWGAFSFEPINNFNSVKLNDYGNLVVSGNVQELFLDREYELVITPGNHHKYKDSYSFIVAKEKKPESIPEQHAYIRSMIRKPLADEIIRKYPDSDIIKLMKEDEFDYKGIRGMREKTYIKTKNTLLLNLDIQEALVELSELNITFKAMKSLIDHFGSASVVVEKVKENIYILCSAPGFGFLKVDSYAMSRGDEKENPNRIVAAIDYILKQEEQSGHSWVSKDRLISTAKELLRIDKTNIESVIEKMEESNRTIYVREQVVALRRNYNYEIGIKEKLLELLSAESKQKLSNIDEKIAKAEEQLSIQYTDEQKEAISMAINNQVFILNGRAGTGKTTVLRGILSVLDQYSYACCALSGKASKIMTALGLNAMTIHRLLGGGTDNKFMYNSENPLPLDIVVLDEASMCSNHIFFSVISAVNKGSKVIILGDSGQLSPIGAGAVFDDILKSKKFPTKELKFIHRQALKSGILSAANMVRDGEQIVANDDYDKKVFGELRDLRVFPVQSRKSILDMIIEVCKGYKGKDDLSEFQVITGLKSRGDISVKNLNIEIQKIFNDTSKPFVKRGGYEYREGDKVIQCGNNYEAGEEGDVCVFNGTMGRIVEIEFLEGSKSNVYIDFDGISETICYTNDQMDQVELGYAISVHKSQGSTIRHVLFAFDYASYMLLSKQFVYTGLTRASKGCVMICELKALRHAIRTDHGSNRNTFLLDMLLN